MARSPDRVGIVLGDDDLRIFERYEVSQRFLQVPAAFSVRIGSGELARILLARYPAGTPYKLFVVGADNAEVPQHSGRLDDQDTDGQGGVTEIGLGGRDSLALLHDDHIAEDRSFSNVTYEQLVTACIQAAGIAGYSLVVQLSDVEANTKLAAGVPSGIGLATRTGVTTVEHVKVLPAGPPVPPAGPAFPGSAATPPPPALAGLVTADPTGPVPLGRQGTTTVENIRAFGAPAAPTAASGDPFANIAANVASSVTAQPAKPLHAKAGHTWYSFLDESLRRAGLFLYAGVDENVFILTRPNAAQTPIYQIVRQRGALRNAVNVLGHRYRNATARRFSHYIVYGRCGGGKDGRSKVRGEVVDQEMVDLGIIRHWVKVDHKAKTKQDAELLAKRKAAEDRRCGWTLHYIVKGHTSPSIVAPGKSHVWAINTVVRVKDDELGVFGNYWIEGVTFRGGPDGETTELTLMRGADLVFGTED